MTDYHNIELLNSLLSNINDDGDNNEKTKNLKTRVGMFKNMGGNIPRGNCLGGNFPGRSFPDNVINASSLIYLPSESMNFLTINDTMLRK